jgi:acyl carrier protein
MPDSTLKRVKEIIAAYKDVPAESVPDDARLREDLDIDSLGAAEIIFDIEEEFHVVIGEHLARELDTVRDVASRVDALVTET